MRTVLLLAFIAVVAYSVSEGSIATASDGYDAPRGGAVRADANTSRRGSV